tara:strand:+ start:79 stop:276 length:198 start_codon:yes stop_codon:yes gene_type:complete
MNLTNLEFELNWPIEVQLKNLRKFILKNISQNGDVIRWSINKIEIKNNQNDQKLLKINAVILNRV